MTNTTAPAYFLLRTYFDELRLSQLTRDEWAEDVGPLVERGLLMVVGENDLRLTPDGISAVDRMLLAAGGALD